MHNLVPGAVSVVQPLVHAAVHPIRSGRAVVEVATFLTRDLRCSAAGHIPVRTNDGIRCRKCFRAPLMGPREQLRWVA